jgi:hypothetical protein
MFESVNRSSAHQVFLAAIRCYKLLGSEMDKIIFKRKPRLSDSRLA